MVFWLKMCISCIFGVKIFILFYIIFLSSYCAVICVFMCHRWAAPRSPHLWYLSETWSVHLLHNHCFPFLLLLVKPVFPAGPSPPGEDVESRQGALKRVSAMFSSFRKGKKDSEFDHYHCIFLWSKIKMQLLWALPIHCSGPVHKQPHEKIRGVIGTSSSIYTW